MTKPEIKFTLPREKVEAARDILINLRSNLQKYDRKIVVAALDIVSCAYDELSKIGPERIKQISEVLRSVDEKALIYFPFGSHERLDPEDHSDIKCGERVLRTYEAISQYLPQVAEFRKVKALDTILQGEELK